MGVIFISGIFMSFFIALLLVTKKAKVLTDKILALWIFIIGIHLLGYYLNQIGYWQKYPHLIGTTAPFPLLHGPMLYLYTLYSLRKDNSLRKIDYLHFAPILLAYLYMFKFFFFYSSQEKVLVDHGEIKSLEIFKYILLVAILISGTTYAYLAYRLTRKHKYKVKNNFSYDEGINLKWLRNCILAIALVFLSATIIYLFREGFGYTFSFNADYIFYIIIILLVFYIGYFGIKHENIFTNNPQIINKIDNQQFYSKYKNSGLKDHDAKKLHKALLKIMNDKKPFLDPKLNLSTLAKLLDTSSNWLSQVINQYEQNNFHDFINKFRVEEFIQKASENKNYSFLALALDSGFNSKSSFNNIFKKCKGVTPSAYFSKIPEEKNS
jgi:AraC-like DNA-binding protein